MAYCVNCGQKLPEDAKFCPQCGKSTDSNSYSKRKTIYDGETHQCPQCGEILDSFITTCPTCRYELRGTKNSNAINALAEKLENTTSEKQRVAIIKSFPVPNTREDIFEFMLLASSNFDASYYATHLDEDDISDAWLAKIEQCYYKAKLSFGSHTDFEQIESVYIKIKDNCAEKERKIKYEEKSKQKEQERVESAREFKNSKLRSFLILLMILALIACAVTFSNLDTELGIVSILIFVLLLISFLMGENVIKETFKYMRLIPMFLAFLLFIFLLNNS